MSANVWKESERATMEVAGSSVRKLVRSGLDRDLVDEHSALVLV